MTTGLASSGNNSVRLAIPVAATAAVVIFVAIAIYGPSITIQNFCIEQHIEPPLNALVFLLSFALEKTIFAY